MKMAEALQFAPEAGTLDIWNLRGHIMPYPKLFAEIVQRAKTDNWIRESCFDESPTMIKRLVEDNGWIICGGLDT